VLRTVWLGLGCLISISGLFALKISFGVPTKLETPSDNPNIMASINVDPAPKADRLDASYVEDTPAKIFIKPIAIVPQKTDVSLSETLTTTATVTPTEKIGKIASRRWHQGFAKMSARTVHKSRVASPSKRRR
jgi:hypothetical protein